MSPRRAFGCSSKAPAADLRRWYAAVAISVVLSAIAAILALLDARAAGDVESENHAALTANLRDHEATFEELREMLSSDARSRRPAGAEIRTLGELSAILQNRARMSAYRALLRRISVSELRYFPSSGRLILLPSTAPTDAYGWTESYAYIPTVGSESSRNLPGYWRGPGIYVMTVVQPVIGKWYIRYDEPITLAFSPY